MFFSWLKMTLKGEDVLFSLSSRTLMYLDFKLVSVVKDRYIVSSANQRVSLRCHLLPASLLGEMHSEF